MNNNDLLKKVSNLGFPMLEKEESLNVNSILAEVVKNKNIRIWEAFPVLLANANKKGTFDYNEVNGLLKQKRAKSNFKTLVMISLSLYKTLNLKFLWAKRMYEQLSSNDKKKLNDFLKKIKHDRKLEVSKYNLSTERIKKTFDNYFLKKRKKETYKLESRYEDFSLEYALSQIFPPKQKELFTKKLNGEKLTKTEQEYYSRVIKKKVIALANSKLHTLAQRLLER